MTFENLVGSGEAARILGVSVTSLDRFVARGAFKVVQTPLGRLLDRGELEAAAREREAVKAAAA